MKGKPRTQQKQHRSRRAFLAFLLPSFLGVAVFVLVPFIDVFRRSFTTAVTGEFTGLENGPYLEMDLSGWRYIILCGLHVFVCLFCLFWDWRRRLCFRS